MKGNLRRLALVSAAFAAVVASPFVAHSQDDPDPAAKEWNQARGNAARTSSSSVEPPAAEPADAWKQALPGPVLGEPVTWGGTVFVAAQKDKSRKLLAFDLATGAPAGDKDLGPGGRVGLATWQGVVLVLDATQIRTFPYQAGKFASGWSLRGTFSAPPCVWRGLCFVCDGDELLCLDVMKGGSKRAKSPVADAKSLAALDETKSVKGTVAGGAVAVFKSRADDAVYAVTVSTLLNVALLSKTRVEDPFGAKVQMRPVSTEVLGLVPGNVGDDDRWEMIPSRVEGEAGKTPGAWVVVAPRAFSNGGAGRAVADAGKAPELPFAAPPAVMDDQAVGFTPVRAIQAWRSAGEARTVVPESDVPEGARKGPATRAGGIVFASGFAIDVTGEQVAWTLKHQPVTAMIPAGDKRVVFATRTELVCVAEGP